MEMISLVGREFANSLISQFDIKLQNLSVFNIIYIRKESVNYKCKCIFNSLIGRMGFSGHWINDKY